MAIISNKNNGKDIEDPQAEQERLWKQNEADWDEHDHEANGFEEVETGRFSVYEFVDEAMSDIGKALESLIMGEPVE